MHRTHDIPRIIRPYRDQTQIKRASEFSYLLERRTVRQVCVFRRVVVCASREVGHRAVAGVAAEPDALAARGDGPGAPESGVAVEGGAGRGVLAGEAGDASCYAVACGEGGRGRVGGGDGDALLAGGGGREGDVDVLPPIELDSVLDAALVEPLSWKLGGLSRNVGSIALSFFSPKGTANNTFGCVSWIFRMLGWERWS